MKRAREESEADESLWKRRNSTDSNSCEPNFSFSICPSPRLLPS